MYTGGAALIAALFSIVFFTSCPNKIDKKEPAQQKVKIIVKAGAHVNLTDNKPIEVKQGTKWREILSKAARKVSYEEDWEAGGWKIGSESGKELTGTDVFNQDTTVFAIAKAGPPKIKLTIKGDSRVQGVPKTIKVLKGSAWSAVKAQAQNAIKFADGYTLKEWRKDKSDGEVLAESFVLDKDTTVFAVSAKSVTITVKGDENVTGTPASFKVLEGSLWGQIKGEALKKIGFKDNYMLASWHLTDGSEPVLQDAYSFTADSTVFAKSKLKPVVNIPITIQGDSHVTVNTPIVQVGKESTWSEIKADIEAAVSLNPDYEIKEWRKDKADGALIQDTDIFTQASTVYAVTKVKLTLTIDGDDKLIAGKGETIKIKSGSKWQDIKAEVEAKIEFADNYTLGVWRKNKADGELISEADTFTENTTVYAVSKTDPNPKVKITISAITPADLTITGTNPFKVLKGSKWADVKAEAEKRIKCSEGYAVKEWQNGSLVSLPDTYEFNADETIYVVTEKLKKVTFEADGVGGGIRAQPAGGEEISVSPLYVKEGTSVTFTAVPEYGYGIGTWTISSGSFVSGGTEGSETSTVTVNEDITVKVSFMPPSNVNFSASGNGTIKAQVEGGGEIFESPLSVPQGKTVTFTALPDPGYGVKNWSISSGAFTSGGKAGDTTSTVIVNGDLNITVTFIQVAEVTFSVWTSDEGTLNASADGYPNLNSGGQVPLGTLVNFTAVPKYGYVVVRWEIKSGTLVWGGKAGNKTATVKANQDTNVEIIFGEAFFDIESQKGSVKGADFEMAKITGKTGKVGHSDEFNNKEHDITLSTYMIGRTEVTQELWRAVMGNEPSYFSTDPDSNETQELRPVENINWYEAVVFCNSLTSMVFGRREIVYYTNDRPPQMYTKADADAKKPVIANRSARGFRLPTEAEWEWAAQGGTDYKKYAGTNHLDELKRYAWFRYSSTHETKLKKPNSYHLYDMSGNVYEWCWDWYTETTPSGGTDPTGAPSGTERIVRGGDFRGEGIYCNVHKRYKSLPDRKDREIGFRFVCRP